MELTLLINEVHVPLLLDKSIENLSCPCRPSALKVFFCLNGDHCQRENCPCSVLFWLFVLHLFSAENDHPTDAVVALVNDCIRGSVMIAQYRTLVTHLHLLTENTAHWEFSSYGKRVYKCQKRHTEKLKYGLTAEHGSTVNKSLRNQSIEWHSRLLPHRTSLLNVWTTSKKIQHF